MSHAKHLRSIVLTLRDQCGRTVEEILRNNLAPRAEVLNWLGEAWYPAEYKDHGGGVFEVLGDSGRWYVTTATTCECLAGTGPKCRHRSWVRAQQKPLEKAA